MWVALSGIATLIVTFLLGRQLASSKEGLLSGMILLMSGGFFLESRLLRPDMLLTLWISLAFYGIVKAEHVTAEHLRTRWLSLSAISLALSVLTKGLVGVIIVTVVTGATLLLCGRLSFLREIRWTYIIPITLCVILSWHLLVEFRNPGFFWD